MVSVPFSCSLVSDSLWLHEWQHAQPPCPWFTSFINNKYWKPLVTSWYRTHLPGWGTRIWSLLQEDSTCHGATKPLQHNYWAHVLQLPKPILRGLSSKTRGAPAMKGLAPRLESNLCSVQLQKDCVLNQDPEQPNTNKYTKCLRTSHSCVT